METPMERFFKTFADTQRIRAAALLLDEALRPEELAARLNISTAEGMRCLGMLGRLELLEQQDGRYHINAKALEALSHAVLARRQAPQQAAQSPEAAQEQAVQRGFFTSEGRLREMPGQAGKRAVALRLVARMFEPGQRYTEKEVNAMLLRVHDDPASLRRYLVDGRLLDRAPDGSAYWKHDSE
jgi:hypothetical protein